MPATVGRSARNPSGRQRIAERGSLARWLLMMHLRKLDQPLSPLAPQLLNGGPAYDPSQPRTLLPAGRQDHLVVIMSPGLRAHGSGLATR